MSVEIKGAAEFAGSMSNLSSNMGIKAPRKAELNIIANKDKQIAAKLGIVLDGVRKTRTILTQTKISPVQMATLNSRNKTSSLFFMLISPVTRPRTIRVADWFPTFPPVPTSIVRKNVKIWLLSMVLPKNIMMKADKLCSRRRGISH